MTEQELKEEYRKNAEAYNALPPEQKGKWPHQIEDEKNRAKFEKHRHLLDTFTTSWVAKSLDIPLFQVRRWSGLYPEDVDKKPIAPPTG